MRILTAAALIASAGISASAYAETYAGPRVAAIAGYDSLSFGSNTHSDDGAALGLGIGYDIPAARNVAFGLDAEILGASAKHRASVIVGGGPPAPVGPPVLTPPPSIVGEVKTTLKRELYLGGRATIPLSSKIGAFLTAGYTNLRIKSHASQTGLVGPVVGGPLRLYTSTVENIDGVRLGIGGQWAASKLIFGSFEYRYANYERGISRKQVVAGIGLRL